MSEETVGGGSPDARLQRIDADLAIGLQLAVQISQGRTMALTSGVPLDWPVEKMHEAVDKMASVVDRQQARYNLQELKRAKAQELAQHRVHDMQVAHSKGQWQAEWAAKGRKGDFKHNDSQLAALAQFDTTKKAREEHLVRLDEQIKEAEAVVHGPNGATNL